MAGTIKNVQISGFDNTVSYDKYDVVSAQTGYYPIYFVSTQSGNSGQFDDSTYLSNAYWKRFDDLDVSFSDVWTPTFQTTLSLDLKPKLSPYGDGYAQKVDASIFFNRLGYEVAFNTIPNKELKSLVAFFEYKGGVDFVKMDVPPFITGRKFVGKNWKHSYSSDNINDFSVTMFEFISDTNV
jgi:phage-related protein